VWRASAQPSTLRRVLAPVPNADNVLVRAAALAFVALAGVAGCNAFRTFEDCAQDLECGRGNRCHPEGHFCETGGPIRVGVVLSLTGNLKLKGQAATCRDALEFAASYLSRGEPRVLDRGITFVFKDDESDVALSGKRTQELVDEGVIAVVGPLTSAQALAAHEATRRAGVPQIAPFAGASALGEALGTYPDRFLFELSPTISNGSPLALVKYLVEQRAKSSAAPACKRTVVLHNADVTGEDFYATYEPLFRHNGMCVRGKIAISTVRKDTYDAEVKSLVEAHPDCVILGLNPDTAGAILEQVERAFPLPQKAPWVWLGNTQTHTPEFLTTTAVTTPAPRSRADGFVGADIDFVPNRREYAEVLEMYQASFASTGQPPPSDLPNRFSVCVDSAFTIALAIERAGKGASSEQVRDAIYSVARADTGDETYSPGQIFDALRALRRGTQIDYKGASSDCELRSDGFLESAPMNIWRVTNGAFDERVRQYADGEALDVVSATLDGCK
jgi:ABC-type branched-subunit amino acid transport system substrate-binding protein